MLTPLAPLHVEQVAKIKANHDNTVVTIGNNGNTLDMHVDDVSSSESEDDIVPGLPRVRKQRRTRDSESKQGGEAKLWNGIDNHSALRAINSVRLDLLKKKALLEQLCVLEKSVRVFRQCHADAKGACVCWHRAQ